MTSQTHSHIPERIQQAIATHYGDTIREDGTVEVHEAECAWLLHSQLSLAPEFAEKSIAAREGILCGNLDTGGVVEFAAVELPDPKSLSPEKLLQVSQAIVRYILSSGVKGFRDTISDLKFGDSPLNGTFTEKRAEGDRVFAYEITQSGGVWNSEISPVSGVSE